VDLSGATHCCGHGRVDVLSINGIEGHLILGDIHYLARVCANLPADPVIIEIGSWKGLSTTAMAHARPDASIYCIDTWLGGQEHAEDESIVAGTLFDEFKENVRPLGSQVNAYRMHSCDAAKYFDTGEADLLFIDGDHTRAGCLLDLQRWTPKVKTGGTVLVHDCNNPGVLAAIDEFANCIEISEPPYAHYMGRMTR
jgi:predicted O-methyltransferase YrrM